MTKVKKVKRKKQYRYGVNRKRVSKTQLRRPRIVNCDPVKKVWEHRKSAKRNLTEMGLCCDTNDVFKIPSNKPDFMKRKKPVDPEFKDKSQVAMELDEESKIPVEKKFRLPNSHVYWLCQLLDKYGEDYKAMARDTKINYFQETWKQIRAKIKVFKGIPEQYNEYLQKKSAEETAEA